jgi:hypothetical protein
MAEPVMVAEVWKTAVYVLCPVIVVLAGTIAGMAKWFMKERLNVATDYQCLNTALLNALDRIGDHLRDLYNKDSEERLSRTHFNFDLTDKG